MDKITKPTFAIIGAGNGGHAFYAHLSKMQFEASLYEIDHEKVKTLKEKGFIKAEGEFQHEAPLIVSNNIGETIKDKAVIMIVVPSIYHKSLVANMVPYLQDGQIIVLNPGATGGALEIRNLLDEKECQAEVTIAETSTLLYACRSPKPGEVIIGSIKDKLYLAALPSNRTESVLKVINQAFPQYSGMKNVLETSLSNVNAIVHPAPTILNAGRIEASLPFKYYIDGVTPSIAQLVEQLDQERLAIGKKLSLDLCSISEWYSLSYKVPGPTLYDKIRQVEAYQGIQAQTSLNTRYLFEDIPTGLVPMSDLAKQIGVETPLMDAFIRMGNSLLNRDFRKEGRSLQDLGLNNKTCEEIVSYVS
ncbi:opine dehydrogenase [Bacillus ectoiniformans]|uniref:NAD/NADP octopine/nopaline dehydrogenase family protein n=1 Tax=Bacillus ectoiniformans TaxID=1494429 RepID=UPI00195E7A97|nr:NAD/NADP-dependent octopine/nopaline dehydrogenase family protein [Bacillus ectoiniformans]MBM7647672.1 opine dehydrogenase [Bacillus ectoiniformans]